MPSYTDRQIEVANLLRDGVSADVVEEVVEMVGDAEKQSIQAAAAAEQENAETIIRLKILEEKDWRKKASLCALLISRSLT